MKRTLLYSLVLGCALICNSCNDFFDIDRPPQLPWTTVAEFERAPIGAYAGLFGGQEWNMAWVNDRIVKASMGDDVGFVENPEWGYQWNSKDYNKYTERNFVQLYRVIATTNNALEFVAQHNGNPFPGAPSSDIENNVNRIIGELHFIRAYAYYILINTFGHAYVPGGDNSGKEIPMPTRYAASVAEARNPKIGSTQEVYDLIVSDLRKAKELLPEQFDASKHHPSYAVRANRFAASGMLMRTYLVKGKYDSALAEANYIIDQNNGAYDLSEDPIQAFNKSGVARGKEVIFYAPFFDLNLPAPNHLSVINHRWSSTKCGWVETYMGFETVKRLGYMTDPESDTTINSTAKNDKRFTQLMAVRYPINKHLPTQEFETRSAISSYTTIWCNKYYRGSNDDRTNVPLIRLAEIYLTRAFLHFINNDKDAAAADLNVVRSRAWDAAKAGTPYVPLTGASLTEQQLDDERILEMFNEGDRLNYLRSIQHNVPLGERGDGTEPYTSEKFVWSIPPLELNFNDAL
jgi:hypothetical protein